MNPDSIETLRHDVSAHAKTLTELTVDQRTIKDTISQMQIERAVRVERDGRLDDRLKGIESNVAAVYSLGKWLLASFGSALMLAVVLFIKNGGLNVPTP